MFVFGCVCEESACFKHNGTAPNSVKLKYDDFWSFVVFDCNYQLCCLLKLVVCYRLSLFNLILPVLMMVCGCFECWAWLYSLPSVVVTNISFELGKELSNDNGFHGLCECLWCLLWWVLGFPSSFAELLLRGMTVCIFCLVCIWVLLGVVFVLQSNNCLFIKKIFCD